MGKLYVGAADNLHRLHNSISLFLQTLLAFFGDGQHGGGAEGVTCMNAKGIDIFNEADGDHIAFFISDYFQLQLFPAKDGFFHQYLTDQAGL